MDSVVVVGASAAGVTAAETLRREGFSGRLTLLGAEPHPPYDRPPLSKQLLSGAWEPDRLVLRPAERLAELDLDLRLAVRATGLDPANRVVEVSDGAPVGYDGLVIATGVRPRQLPGGDLDGVYYLRTLDEALALRGRLTDASRMVVVGAGFIGAEAAATARGIGARVTMIEPEPVPMGRVFGPVVGGMLADLHRERGVDLRCGTTVTELVGEGGRVSGVRLGGGEVVPADVVVVGIGSVPVVDWLAGSGLPVGDGVECDQYCAAAPGIYAAGDVARWHNPLFGTSMRVEHRTNAAEQGMAVARNLLAEAKGDLDARVPFAPVPYFWSDQYELKLQAWGHPHGACDFTLLHGSLEERRFVAAYGDNGRMVGAVGLGMLRELREARSLIASRAAWNGSRAG